MSPINIFVRNYYSQRLLYSEEVIKMARGKRTLLDNAYYHVINRGNQKQNIFFAELDYINYLRILKHYKRKYGFKLFGYCLMPNHVHLIINPALSENLAKIMQSITQTYTTWFNKKYTKVGHLWQGRFKSMVIEKNSYFLDCIN
ncbi:MAG: hypothetical protein A3G38_01990 [Omnitrophica WOR_2 bacterium RIFCSPLOWO2_12_FULL_51_8]|nr:MAG: hypothetical protein A3G38_01990 [Omnitrophica WOR_2 bacterium RIFCSPLOWO2_12_FULL_51_8]